MSEKNGDGFVGKKDFAWKYARNESIKDKYHFCKFCDQKCTGGINRLKHHLAGTSKGMKKCPKVPDSVRLECDAALKTFRDVKNKQNAILEEIGAGPMGNYDAGMSFGSGSGAENSVNMSKSGTSTPTVKGPMDKFTASNPRQSTLNTKWKKDERKEVCRQIGRFIYSAGLLFNVVNDPYWKPAVDGIARYGIGFEPPSMQELRTWVLRAEVEDINGYMEEHKTAWKEYGGSIMSDGWT